MSTFPPSPSKPNDDIIIDDNFIADIPDDSLRKWCRESLCKDDKPYTVQEILLDTPRNTFVLCFDNMKDRRKANAFFAYLLKKFHSMVASETQIPHEKVPFLLIDTRTLPEWKMDNISLLQAEQINGNAILYLENCIDVKLGTYMNTGVESLLIFACLIKQRKNNNTQYMDLPVLTDNFGSGKSTTAKNFLLMTRLVYRYLGPRFYALINRFERDGRSYKFDGEPLLRSFLEDSSKGSDYTPQKEEKKIVDDLLCIHSIRIYNAMGDAIRARGVEESYNHLLEIISSLRDKESIHVFDDIQNFFSADCHKNAFVLFRGFRSACESVIAKHNVCIVVAGRGLGFFSLHSKESVPDGGLVTPISLQCLNLAHTHLLVHRNLFSNIDFQKDDRVRQAAQLVHEVAAGVPLAVERVLDQCKDILQAPQESDESQLNQMVKKCVDTKDTTSRLLCLALPEFSEVKQQNGLLSLFLNLVWLHIANHSVSKRKNVYAFLSPLIQSIIKGRGCSNESATTVAREETDLARICSLLPGYYDIHGEKLRIHLPLISNVDLPSNAMCTTPLAFLQRARNKKTTGYYWEECSRQCITAYILLHENLKVLDLLSGSSATSFSTIPTAEQGYHVDLSTGEITDLYTLTEVKIQSSKPKSIFKTQVVAPSYVVTNNSLPSSKANPIDFALHVFNLVLHFSTEWLKESNVTRAVTGPLVDFSVVSENSSAVHLKAFLQSTGDRHTFAYRLVLISVQDKWGPNNSFDLMSEFEKTWMFHCCLPVLQKKLSKEHSMEVHLHMEHAFLLIAPCANKGTSTYNQYTKLSHASDLDSTLTNSNALRLKDKQLNEIDKKPLQYWTWLRNRSQEASHQKDFKNTSYDCCSMTDHIILVTNRNVKHLYGDNFAKVVYKDPPSSTEAQSTYIRTNYCDTHSMTTYLGEDGPTRVDFASKKRLRDTRHHRQILKK